MGAQITVKNGRSGPMAVGVCYDRNSPSSPTVLSRQSSQSSQQDKPNDSCKKSSTVNTSKSSNMDPPKAPIVESCKSPTEDSGKKCSVIPIVNSSKSSTVDLGKESSTVDSRKSPTAS